MPPETWRFVRSIRVLDSAGEPRTVRVYRTVFDIPVDGLGVMEVEGTTRAVLDDGTWLTDMGGGRYEAAGTGEGFTAIDPEAG